MLRFRAALLAVLMIFVASTAGRAGTIFTAILTHDQETTQGALTTSAGDPRPLSFGSATFILNDAETELAFTATIFNIDVTGTQTPDTFDNLVAAHIHVGAPPGMNAPVRWGFFGSPDNDNNPDNLVVTPFATGVGGTFSSIWNQPEGNGGTTLSAQLPAIRAGLAYINFHTVQFAGGEIRGQIVPEPSSIVLSGLGGLILVGAACCRRAARRV
jgi:CHRD domain/PEP-CTERM motif